MKMLALEAPAPRSVGIEPLALATFIVVGLAFSRISESVEASTGLLPISSVVGILAIGLVLWSRTERASARPMLAVLGVLACLHLAVAAFSAVDARDPSLAFESLDGQLRSIAIAAAVVVLVTTPRRLQLALSAVVWGTLLVASVSCLQALTGSYESTYLGLAKADLAALDTGAGWRLGGPLGDPNFFAQLLTVGVAVSVARCMAVRRSGVSWVVPMAATLLGTTALLLTYSRGGLVAFGASLLLIAARWLSWRAAVAAVVVGIVLVAVAPDALTERLLTAAEDAPTALAGEPVADTAINGRASEAIVGYQVFSDHWLLGVGPGNYPAHYLDYAHHLGLDVRGTERSAHSLVVETLAETGIVGLAALTALVLVAFAAVGSLRRQFTRGETDQPLWWCAVAVEAGLVAHLACALFLHSAYPRGLWLMLGLAFACGQVTRGVTRSVEPAAV